MLIKIKTSILLKEKKINKFLKKDLIKLKSICNLIFFNLKTKNEKNKINSRKLKSLEIFDLL